MQYYILNQDKDYTDNVEIVNWFGKLDVEKLEPEKYYQLDESYVLEAKGNELTDMIFTPFFAVSPMVRYCIKAYEPNMKFTAVTLWSKQKKEAYEYFIPHLDRLKILSSKSVLKYNNTLIEKAILDKNSSIHRYIFLLADLQKKHVVIKKELAESVLKRNARGISFLGIEEE